MTQNIEAQSESNLTELSDVPSSLDVIIQSFCDELIKKEDWQLLALIFSKNPTQEDLNKFLQESDIEVMESHKSLMLSYFMKANPNLEFSDYEKPRLNGLIDYYRFDNVKKLGYFVRVGKALNKKGIPILLFKDGAMKYLRPELSRPMDDIDILVPWDKFFEAADVASRLSYTYCTKNMQHSAALHIKGGECILDIHRCINMGSMYKKRYNKYLFARATRVKAFGVKVLLPSDEDLMFTLLTNLGKNIKNKTSITEVLYSLFDSKFLLESKENFDWNIVVNNTKITKTYLQVQLAINFINSVIPGLFPDDLINKDLLVKEVNHCYNLLMSNNLYFNELQEKSRALKFKPIAVNLTIEPSELICISKDIMNYLNLKSQYLLSKNIRKVPFLLHLFLKTNYKDEFGIEN